MSIVRRNSRKTKSLYTFLQFKKLKTNSLSTTKCRVICWNVLSILNEHKLVDFLQILDDNNIDIACVCETWFNARNEKLTAIIKEAGFGIVHCHRDDKRGGGTAALYKKTQNVKEGEASTSAYSSFEYSYIFLNVPDMKVLIVCVYRQKEISCNIFCDEFETFIEKIFDKADTIIVMGDFNVWVDIEDNIDTKKLLNLMHGYGLSQLVHEPTHKCGHTLDHVYVNVLQLETNHNVINDIGDFSTDHYPIILELPTSEVKQATETLYYRKTRDIDIDCFKKDLHEMYSTIDFDQGSNNFSTNYINYKTSSKMILDKHAPLKTKKIRPATIAPWSDAEFRDCRSKRRNLEKKWRKNKTGETREAYTIQRKICAEMSIAKQKEYYTNLVDTVNSNQKSLFKIVDNILDKSKNIRTLPTHTDPLQLANNFNEYYIKKVENIRKSIPTAKTNVNEHSDNFEGETLDTFALVTEEDLKQIITESGIKTSDQDPIPANLMRIIITEAIPCLTRLVNQSLSEGSIDGVKQSVIDPLLKKSGLDSDILKNYRPVNNLEFFSKLIERVVLKQLDTHLTNNNLHCDSQYGYKQYHSTETMMLGIMSDVLTGFDNDMFQLCCFWT